MYRKTKGGYNAGHDGEHTDTKMYAGTRYMIGSGALKVGLVPAGKTGKRAVCVRQHRGQTTTTSVFLAVQREG